MAKISIHAPSRERRLIVIMLLCDPRFQSTLPRGSDSLLVYTIPYRINFNPRSLAGATDFMTNRQKYLKHISIHAPSRERLKSVVSWTIKLRFQSTLPRGSDNGDKTCNLANNLISIHAPSRERLGATDTLLLGGNISIHAPSRERRTNTIVGNRRSNFNPRSLAGATCLQPLSFSHVGISIHAPSRERLISDCLPVSPILFQSTLPRGSDCCKWWYV